ncbi:MAG: response regulator [Alphaproteobacteria bacterium]|nr:response regulator [Alphaproteobacteria bacterium]
MVHGFAGQSGGQLEIESEVGVGTTVQLRLPKVEEGGVIAEEVEQVIPPTGSELVLLVEDDDAVLDSLAFSLEYFGYTTIKAEDGAKALSILKERSVDILITDLVMPGGTGGTKLVQLAREDHPELPVVYITGYSHDISDIVGSRKEDQLLNKPFTDVALAQAVRQALDGRSGRDSKEG